MSNERNIQRLLRRILDGDPPDVFLRSQYSVGMELPGTLGDLSVLTSEEEERLGLAIAQLHEDRLEMLAADYLAARQDTVDLLHQFTDEQLAALVPTVVGDATAGDVFASHAGHAVEHMTSIEEGFRQGV